MAIELTAGVVRILKLDNETAGTGFVLTNDGLIITCAHVIRSAGAGPGDTVSLIFRCNNDKATAVVELEGWYDPESEDIAILRLNGALPDGVESLALGSIARTANHLFETFGFPDTNPDAGLWGKGEILRETTLNGMRVLQLQSQQISSGFSGAPVRDIETGLIIGIVTAIANSDKHGRGNETAFATPIEALRNIWPKLKITEITYTLQVYLKWLINQHGILDTPVRQAGRLPKIPLDKVYVALRGDRASSFERNQSHSWLEKMVDEFEATLDIGELSPEDRHHIRWRILARSPLSPYLEERNRLSFESELRIERITLGEAFQGERQLVILGDPGSGKTTLARWLTQKLAKALLEGQPNIIVPAIQVNPEAEEADASLDLGPTRLPVLIRVSEFAEYREKHEKYLPLAEFLGYHSWIGNTPTYLNSHPNYGKSFPGEELNELILDYLRRDQAVIILDGLDEIMASNQRDEITETIEQFIHDWIGQRGTILFEGQSEAKSVFQVDDPKTSGGNQIVVTSRITGYYAAYLKGNLTHVTIEPMSDKAVRRFCEAWVREIHLALSPEGENRVELEKRAKEEADNLKTEILESDRRGVRDLASNPFLITVLAAVYHTNRGHLPEQRAALYRLAIENLAQVWGRRNATLMDKDEMIIQVMAPLAAYIHEKYPTGLITKQEIISKQVEEYLALYWGENPKKLTPTFKEEAKRFLRTLGECYRPN